MPTSSGLTIAVRDARLWVTPSQTIDMDNSRIIEDHFRAAFESHHGDVVFDLSETLALFSSGIGLIMRLYNVVKESGKQMHIVNAAPRIREAMENMGLGRILDIHDAGTPLEF